ncbi:hypothetical protein C8R46DRAFT_1212232 [Mycena filopes]|nr:hypothetical protein C8R46DRAFT_1212232 [Mycena filopes]
MTDLQAKAAPATAKATVKPGRFPVSPEVAEFLATLLPDSSPQNMQNFFDDTFDTGDGYDAAMNAFYSYRDVATSGVMIGATSPPSHPDFPVISVDAGPFTIRYNSVYPAHLQANTPFAGAFISPGGGKRVW